MKRWIKCLLALQDVDMRLRGLEERLKMIPQEKERFSAELDSEREKLRTSKENSQKVQLDIKNVESEIAKANNEISKLQSQSVMVKKNDEYKALMKEIENCKGKISDLETKEINLLDRMEEEKSGFQAIERAFSEHEKNIEANLKELDEISGELKQEIENIKANRSQFESQVDHSVLGVYNRLLGRGKGAPFVRIHEGNCGNCHLKLTPQTINEARKAEMVLCDNCGYMIYLEEIKD